MLNECADEVVVLTLERNKRVHQEIIHHLASYKINPTLYKVAGVKNGINNVEEKASLYEVFTHTAGDEVSRDIIKNHIRIIRDAYKRGVNRLMILEDDARFIKEMDKVQIQNMKNFINNDQWDIFFLGYCPWPYAVSFPVHKNIVYIPTPLLAHAYIINPKGMKKILEFYDISIQQQKEFFNIDKMFSVMPDFKKYGVYPSICFQNKAPALFDYSKKRLRLPFEFNTMVRYLEHFALLWPILLLLVVIYMIVKSYLSKK